MAKWIKRSGSSRGAVATRSRHKTAHVLDLFADENPNPSLRLYLDLVAVFDPELRGPIGIDDQAAVTGDVAGHFMHDLEACLRAKCKLH